MDVWKLVLGRGNETWQTKSSSRSIESSISSASPMEKLCGTRDGGLTRFSSVGILLSAGCRFLLERMQCTSYAPLVVWLGFMCWMMHLPCTEYVALPSASIIYQSEHQRTRTRQINADLIPGTDWFPRPYCVLLLWLYRHFRSRKAHLGLPASGIEGRLERRLSTLSLPAHLLPFNLLLSAMGKDIS